MKWTAEQLATVMSELGAAYFEKPATIVIAPTVWSRLIRSLGYKTWIESKGKRGKKPPRDLMAQSITVVAGSLL